MSLMNVCLELQSAAAMTFGRGRNFRAFEVDAARVECVRKIFGSTPAFPSTPRIQPLIVVLVAWVYGGLVITNSLVVACNSCVRKIYSKTQLHTHDCTFSVLVEKHPASPERPLSVSTSPGSQSTVHPLFLTATANPVTK